MSSKGSGAMASASAVLIGLVLFLLGGIAAAEVTNHKWEDERLFVPPYGQRGCWVLFFAGKEFDPPVAKLNGPTFIEQFEDGSVVTPELKRVGGPIFLRGVQSAIIGPRARLLGYQEIRFSNRALELEPGQQVADLVDIGFHERVKSLQVECVRTQS